MKRDHYVRFGVLLCACAGLSMPAEVRPDSSKHAWILKTGLVEYRLRQVDGAVRPEYFGPSGSAAWRTDRQRNVAQDISGTIEGQPVAPEDLELKLAEPGSAPNGVETLRLLYQHRRLSLQIEAVYSAWGDTGVISRKLKLTNLGSTVLHVESLPELSWRLPPGEYDLTYLWGGWGQEKQVATETLGAGRRTLANLRGRSTSLYSPWFSLDNKTLGVRYLGELAYSGNWKFQCERLPGTGRTSLRQGDLMASLGTEYDFEGALALAPGASRNLPEVAFTATSGDLDEAANQMHRYQRRYVFARTPTNDPLLVQFNSWYPFPGKMTVQQMKDCAEVAAELGAEVFVLDAGWYNKKDWSSELGDYEADRVAFPNGIEELSRHVRGKGMKFGIWVEIENIGIHSEMFKKHPDWLLSYNGTPLLKGERMMLNFAKPEVRQWAHAVVDRLVKNYELEWMKIDYNIDVGSVFDPAAPNERTGAVLLDHIMSYYAWLDEVRAKHPKLVIENCASGGMRFDSGIAAHTHTTWLSDEVAPLPSVQLAYGCTLAFAPQVCNHWMVGEGEGARANVDASAPPGWWDFMLRVPMNGQFGISSRVFDWSPAMRKRATENVALYKSIRTVIAAGDVYHLTRPPSNQDPKGWMALQYVTPDKKRSVLMAYRLGDSKPEETFKLRGLDPAAWYRVTVDGKSFPAAMTQQELALRGLPIKLDAEWRSAVIELAVEQ
jgi:alpha-galactosidase